MRPSSFRSGHGFSQCTLKFSHESTKIESAARFSADFCDSAIKSFAGPVYIRLSLRLVTEAFRPMRSGQGGLRTLILGKRHRI